MRYAAILFSILPGKYSGSGQADIVFGSGWQ
jgi:hypothetical protein